MEKFTKIILAILFLAILSGCQTLDSIKKNKKIKKTGFINLKLNIFSPYWAIPKKHIKTVIKLTAKFPAIWARGNSKIKRLRMLIFAVDKFLKFI